MRSGKVRWGGAAWGGPRRGGAPWKGPSEEGARLQGEKGGQCVTLGIGAIARDGVGAGKAIVEAIWAAKSLLLELSWSELAPLGVILV